LIGCKSQSILGQFLKFSVPINSRPIFKIPKRIVEKINIILLYIVYIYTVLLFCFKFHVILREICQVINSSVTTIDLLCVIMLIDRFNRIVWSNIFYTYNTHERREIWQTKKDPKRLKKKIKSSVRRRKNKNKKKKFNHKIA